MDIKDLNKPQLILLSLLLSFVASIATSITTMTLMQQAPLAVTAPINRIVKQTVEKIQQVEGKTTVQTVVVKEEDLVVDAIAKNQSSIFTISRDVADDSGKLIEVSAGKGFILDASGIIVADSSIVSELGLYYVKNDSGKFKADYLWSGKDGYSFLKVGAPLDEKNKLIAPVPVFGDLSLMKAGQKILFLGSSISSTVFDGNKDNIRLSVTKSGAGGLVLNLEGEVLGIGIMNDNASFASATDIADAWKNKDMKKEIPKSP